MELAVEPIIENALSDYEIERGKPMPNLTHGIIQANIGFELKIMYQKKYRIASEVTLDTLPKGSTPDLIILPNRPLDFTKEIPARLSEAPLVTIEIQSPSQSFDEMLDKVIIYFEFGVQSCWVVQPRIKGVFVFETPFEYKFYHNEILNDSKLEIELDLKKVFE